MDSVWVVDQVVGEAYHALGVEACGEGEEHHKMALEEVWKVDAQMGEEVGIPRVEEVAKGALWGEEGACLEPARGVVVMWVEWEVVLTVVLTKMFQGWRSLFDFCLLLGVEEELEKKNHEQELENI